MFNDIASHLPYLKYSSLISVNKRNNVWYERQCVVKKNIWRVNGKKHRDGDLPAFEDGNGRKEWWRNGKRHRDRDKPAIEWKNGSKEWYKNGNIHRDGDFPAFEDEEDGTKEWFKNGKKYFPLE